MEKNTLDLIVSRKSEQWRTSRLEKACRTFLRIYGISEAQAGLLIESVEDSKGELIIKWKHGLPPTPEQRRAFQIAWEVCGESNTHHNGEAA